MDAELIDRTLHKSKTDKNLLQVITTEELEKVLGIWEDFNIGVEEKGKITFLF